MTSQYRHRRTSNPATPTPTLEPGEIAVNTANRQIAVGDAASGSVGAPLNLLAVQIFDTRAQYPIGSFVTNAGVLYRAKVAVSPAVFDISQWEMMVGAVDPRYVEVAGDTMTGALNIQQMNGALNIGPIGSFNAAATINFNPTSYSGLEIHSTTADTAGIILGTSNFAGTGWYWAWGAGQNFINVAGAWAYTGTINVPTPTIGGHAANADYVNTVAAAKVAKAGDTMTGQLNVIPTGSTEGIQLFGVTGQGRLSAVGTAADIALLTTTKGAGSFYVFTDNFANTQLIVAHQTTPGYIQMFGGDGNANLQMAGGSNGNRLGINNATLHGTPAATADPTTPLGVATKQYVDNYAAPFDALAYNGMQLNGSFDVNQEVGRGNTLTGSGYIADTWWLQRTGTMVHAASTATPFAHPFVNWLNIAITTAQTSLGASDFLDVYQIIEGYRFARMAWGTPNAQPLTIGFWTCHHRTGTYTGFIRSSGGTRSYNFSYTQNVADAAEYKTITIPGDTAGTWLKDNGVGAQIGFTLAAGTSVTAPALNVWGSVNYVAGPGQVNAVATTSDIFRLTGLIALPGTQAPTAARSPFIMRPFDQELLPCQRYLFMPRTVIAGSAFASGTIYSTNSAIMYGKYATTMRAAPTFGLSAVADFGLYGGGVGVPATAISTSGGSPDSYRFDVNVGSSFGTGGVAVVLLGVAANGFLKFDARL